MTNSNGFLSKQSVGFYLSIITAVCAALAAAGYAVTIGDRMGTSALAFAALITGIAVQAASVILAQNKAAGKFFSHGVFFGGALFMAALVSLLLNRMNWFINIASSNDVPLLHTSFFFTVTMCVISACAGVAAAFFRIRKEA
jgi:hypothetical protein